MSFVVVFFYIVPSGTKVSNVARSPYQNLITESGVIVGCGSSG